MRYARIRKMDISNGKGVGVALFVQGCHFHCNGCFNQETWDFKGGKLWTPQIEEQFIELANRSYIKRISILGGEPLADENVHAVLELLMHIRSEFKDEKSIWMYTGYVIEDIIKNASNEEADHDRNRAIHLVDYLIDGRFELDKQDIPNKYIVFAGSTNQRIIDMNGFDPNLYCDI